MTTYRNNHDPLSAALDQIHEDRLPERAYTDETYEEALQADRRWTYDQAEAKKSQKVRLLLQGVRVTLASRGIEAEVTEANDLLLVYGGERVSVRGCLSFWGFPEKVEVTEHLRAATRDHMGRIRRATEHFRKLKSGAFNVQKIADAVTKWARYEADRVKSERTANDNSNVADQLRAKLGLKKYASLDIVPSTTMPGKVRVDFKLCHSMTPEKAEQLIALLRDEGIVKEDCFETSQ
jgi:hypothetical protein